MRMTILALLLLGAPLLTTPFTVQADDHQKAVLITGATSGIGRLTAEHLAKQGYFVYAGARKAEDIAELNRIENIQAVRLDVTKQDEIDAAVELIRAEGRGLWGLVNNAGVNVIGPLIEVPDDDIEWLFDVNVYGVFRVTKAFAPLIIESEGRIVNISSISGFGSGGAYGAYSMTKHAVEAYTDSLRLVMGRLNVSVSAIEPGNYKSEIGTTRCLHMLENAEQYESERFPEMMKYFMDDCRERIETGVGSTAPEPVAVAQAIEHALFAETPKVRYLVTPNSGDAEWALRSLVWELATANHDHEFSFSRDQLVAWLDEDLSELAQGGTDDAFDRYDACEPSDDLSFVCGPLNAEDLVVVPGTDWMVASSLTGNTGLYLVNGQSDAWSLAYPTNAPAPRHDTETYGSCPGAPDPTGLVTHGLNIRATGDRRSTLYVVGHGAREAIEVFEVDASGSKPVITWTGCVTLPDGMEANSVTSMQDGTLLATVPLHPGFDIADAVGGEVTGAVYAWSPGDDGFTMIEGTGLPYGNGIEVSADESEFYIASSGLAEVIAYSNTNPARRLRSTGLLDIVPDNLHMDKHGRLVTAGLLTDYPGCGATVGNKEFDLAEFASCPRPFAVVAVNPVTMERTDLARTTEALPTFSNITMAVEAGGKLWIGTFGGDRIAYQTLRTGSE